MTGQDIIDWLELWFLFFASIWLIAQPFRWAREKKLKKALKYEPPNIHGAAAWADDKELKKKDLFKKSGIPLGRSAHSGKEIYFPGTTHGIVFGGTGTGKTTQALIPIAMTWRESAVFL